MNGDFYIGYLPKMPAGLRRFVRRVIVSLGVLAAVLAIVFALAQSPFAKSYFEFGKVRDFEGTVIAEPYPALLVSRPGQAGPNLDSSEYLMVAPGKHGADDLVRNFISNEVRLRGQLIYRDGQTMVEIEPGSIRRTDMRGPGLVALTDVGPITASGEIVDSKCYLGVMNPGSGKVHRDCASRCLSGGIPPLFVDSLAGKQFLLVSQDGGALPYSSIKEFIGEPLTVHGEHLQRGDQQLLRIDPRQLQHSDGVFVSSGSQ